uniref:Flavodoxin-like fold domain-containing protein n=1 Tax=Gouania willdenowi TaxID=441366 RepID=A0A8C5DQQ3_GOUWI
MSRPYVKKKSCTVDVSDLYDINFKATATDEDITGGEDKLSSDIVKEQSKLKKVDLVIFQFPMYWFSVPAILKGWIDLSAPFHLRNDAILSFTTESLESTFSPNAINGDMNVTLWPLQNGILHYCGFQVLGSQSSGLQPMFPVVIAAPFLRLDHFTCVVVPVHNSQPPPWRQGRGFPTALQPAGQSSFR